jgi:hypothetical protein
MMEEEPMPITDLRPDYTSAMDVRGEPTTTCPCGCEIWNVKTVFDHDTGEVILYFRDMECAQCGTLATAPLPNEALEEDDADL